MKLRIKGKQYVYTHECNPSEKGLRLSKSDMQIFVTDCLIKSYEIRGTDCIRHTPDFNSEADFSYNKLGKTVCGVVKYGLSKEEESDLFSILFNEDRFKEVFPQLYKGFREYNSYPVFYFAEAKCIDTNDGSPIAGGRFEIVWTPIQPLYTVIPTSGPNISEFEMYQGYARSWETGDVSFIEKYVSPWFEGVSELSFDCTTSKAEQIALIKSQHESWKLRHVSIKAKLIKDTDSGDKGILMLLNGKPSGFVVLKFKYYRISRSETRVPPTNYVEWKVKHELYQTHGDHHAPFVNDEDLHGFLKEMMEDSSICLKLDTEVKFDENNPIQTRTVSLKYIGNEDIDDIAYLALVAYNPIDHTNVFISCYPYLKGVPVKVEIIDILEWDNKLEATIQCRYSVDDEDFDFHFFATDYYFNKDYYKIGAKVEISLAATSGNVKEASKGFTFEGQQAIDFLAKMGEKPTYNEHGEVEPLRFSTENLVAFLPHDERCPDMAEFQSPTWDFFYDTFYGNDVNRCIIKLHNDPNIEVPLYFNDGFEPKNGEPITGWVWLSGRLSNPCELSNSVMKKCASLKMEKTSAAFLQSISKLVYQPLVDVAPLLETLNNLSVPEGKHLYGVRIGNSSRYKYEIFVADLSVLSTIRSYINKDGFIDWQSEGKYDEIADDSRESLIGEGIEAVWQSFLLSIAGKYMPHNKTYSWEFSYILTKEDAEKSSKDLNGRIKYLSLLPAFSQDKNGSGYFSVMVWNKGDLYRQVYTYTIGNKKISFLFDESYKVFDSFNTEMDDSHILFRE